VQPGTSAPLWAQLLPLFVIVVVLTIRFLRPQRISVTRMWLQPIILCFLAAWLIYVSESVFRTPPLPIVVAVAIGAIAGIPFGILRGMHTEVRPTDRPGVMYLGASWITMLVFIAAFGLRFAIRLVMPQTGSLGSVAGDGLLGFAIAFVIASYVVIYRKYCAEIAGRPLVN
jgi:hypothetical protein